MKKKTVNAFTLVEMLIVIVIIGILIAALLPRMQAAQGRARDVSRKTALSQIQSAIVVSQGDKGAWPGMNKNKEGLEEGKTAINGLNIEDIKKQLEAAGLNGIPEDPLNSTVIGLGDNAKDGQYRYMVLPRNGTPAGGFILMAKTEVEGGSNWVYCDGADDDGINKGHITAQTDESNAGDATDLKGIIPCGSLVQDENKCGREDVEEGEESESDVCYYKNDGQLRYIVTY